MSMNLILFGSRDILVKKTGKDEVQIKNIRLWQTPTTVTRSILSNKTYNKKLTSYFEWVLSVSEDEEEMVYDKKDIFCEGEPIGKKIVNSGVEHIKHLNKMLSKLKKEGYDFEFGEQ